MEQSKKMAAQDLETAGIGFFRLPQVLAIIPVSRSGWWAGVASGKYPQKVRLGPNTVGWKKSEILALAEKMNKETKL